MQNKGWLTKKEANAIIDVALKVQQGDTNGFKTDKQEKEYTKWNITMINQRNEGKHLEFHITKFYVFSLIYYSPQKNKTTV